MVKMGAMSLKAAILFCLLCGVVWAGSAQAPASKPDDHPAKVAVVQFQGAVTATSEFQRDFAELQKRFEPKQAELKTVSDEVDRLTKQLQTDSARLNEAEQESRAKALDLKKRQAQRLAEDAQAEYERATEELFNRVAEKLGSHLTQYAADHGYTLVMDRSEEKDQTPAVLWANPSIDITQQVVDTYNAKSGAAPQAKPVAPAPSKPPVPR